MPLLKSIHNSTTLAEVATAKPDELWSEIRVMSQYTHDLITEGRAFQAQLARALADNDKVKEDKNAHIIALQARIEILEAMDQGNTNDSPHIPSGVKVESLGGTRTTLENATANPRGHKTSSKTGISAPGSSARFTNMKQAAPFWNPLPGTITASDISSKLYHHHNLSDYAKGCILTAMVWGYITQSQACEYKFLSKPHLNLHPFEHVGHGFITPDNKVAMFDNMFLPGQAGLSGYQASEGFGLEKSGIDFRDDWRKFEQLDGFETWLKKLLFKGGAWTIKPEGKPRPLPSGPRKRKAID
jgi:hypothetical protein